MALDQTCIPTIRGEVVRQRQAAMLHALEAGLLAHEAAGRSAPRTSARYEKPPTGRLHGHWPSRLVPTH